MKVRTACVPFSPRIQVTSQMTRSSCTFAVGRLTPTNRVRLPQFPLAVPPAGHGHPGKLPPAIAAVGLPLGRLRLEPKIGREFQRNDLETPAPGFPLAESTRRP